MPNHVTNSLTFYKPNTVHSVDDATFRHILMTLQGDDPERSYGSVDFNVLIPMPKELNIIDSSKGDNGLLAYKKFLLEATERNVRGEGKAKLEAEHKSRFGDDEGWELGKKYHENFTKYGCKTWYNWAIQHWGTKWNAYDCTHDGEELRFLTAWAAPHHIVKLISKRFPDVEVHHAWADEGIGYNVGRAVYLGGELIDEDVPEEGSTEAYDMAADIMHLDLAADCGLVLGDDGYHYADEDDF